MNETLRLVRLLQMASPMLPVGAYAYSQGMEWLIDEKMLTDVQQIGQWIHSVMELPLAQYELPVLLRMMRACHAGDADSLADWNGQFVASRDTTEGRAETLQMGYSLLRLAREMPDFGADDLAILAGQTEVAFPCAWAWMTSAWQLDETDSMLGYAWSWLENQVAVVMKTLPLGQVAGQTLLAQCGKSLPEIVRNAMDLPDDMLNSVSPLYSMAGCWHETQYSRLFRS